MTKKAQSALEYLMTYGWAILIIVIVGAALYALGVFNPASSTSLTMAGVTNFQLIDAVLNKTSNNLTVIIGTKTGKTTTLSNIDFEVDNNCLNTAVDAGTVLSPSGTQIIQINGTDCSLQVEGSKVNIDIDFFYTVAGSPLVKTESGIINGVSIVE
jgi:hypothetical protein